MSQQIAVLGIKHPRKPHCSRAGPRRYEGGDARWWFRRLGFFWFLLTAPVHSPESSQHLVKVCWSDLSWSLSLQPFLSQWTFLIFPKLTWTQSFPVTGVSIPATEWSLLSGIDVSILTRKSRQVILSKGWHYCDGVLDLEATVRGAVSQLSLPTPASSRAKSCKPKGRTGILKVVTAESIVPRYP